MEGEVTLIEDGHILECKKGEAIFVSADCDFKLKSNTHATLYKATAPTS
jgi:mannose-6-phosphate isomerase class I